MPLVARSEILARIPQTESERETTLRARRVDTGRSQEQIDADAREAIQKLHKLDDVAPALDKLVALRSEETQSSHNYRNDSALNAALQGLDSLQRSILEYRNGLAPGIGRLLTGTEYGMHPDINLILWNLRLQLIREAAPQLMGVPADQKPGDDEPVGVYLRRLVESAKSRQDWAAVIEGQQILRTLSNANGNSYPFGNEPETSAYQNLLAADNLEKAGQFGEAVTMYLSVLHTGQKDLPAVWIGQHLAAIQKAHPEEYARGQGRSSDESRATYLEMIRAYQSMYGALADRPPNPVAASPTASPAATATRAPTITPAPTATPAPKPAPPVGPQP